MDGELRELLEGSYERKNDTLRAQPRLALVVPALSRLLLGLSRRLLWWFLSWLLVALGGRRLLAGWHSFTPLSRSSLYPRSFVVPTDDRDIPGDSYLERAMGLEPTTLCLGRTLVGAALKLFGDKQALLHKHCLWSAYLPPHRGCDFVRDAYMMLMQFARQGLSCSLPTPQSLLGRRGRSRARPRHPSRARRAPSLPACRGSGTRSGSPASPVSPGSRGSRGFQGFQGVQRVQPLTA